MKYWASDIAVIPIEGSPGLAETGIAPENEWLSSGIASWMLCGEHHRRLFLQLLFGSLCLIIGHQTAQATPIHPAPYPKFTLLHHPYRGEAVHFYPQLRALLNLYGNYSAGWAEAATWSESPNEAGTESQAPGPGQSKIEHQRSGIKNYSGLPQPPNAAKSNITNPPLVSQSQPAKTSTGSYSFLHSFTPSFLSPNGALLAHQTTSISKCLFGGSPRHYVCGAGYLCCKLPLLEPHFVIFSLQSAAMKLKNDFVRTQNQQFSLSKLHLQTSTNPSPTARNGVAARTPLPEAGERDKKMNHHFQICTKGYLAGPGIPVPASGLFIGHSEGNHRVNVEKWKSGKDGQQACSEFGMALFGFRYSPVRERLKISIQFFKKYGLLNSTAATPGAVRNSVFACLQGSENQYSIFQKARFTESLTPQHHNTITPQHHNTPTPQHHNTTTPQHHNTATPQHHNTPTPLHPPPKPGKP